MDWAGRAAWSGRPARIRSLLSDELHRVRDLVARLDAVGDRDLHGDDRVLGRSELAHEPMPRSAFFGAILVDAAPHGRVCAIDPFELDLAHGRLTVAEHGAHLGGVHRLLERRLDAVE